MRHDIGTLAWCRRTGGTLSFRDTLAQMADGIALQMRVLPRQLAWKLGLPRRLPEPVDVAGLRAPDSAAAKAAEEHCREVSEPYLVNHCLRSYLWGRILAAGGGLDLDDELFYVASLLHDLGLTKHYETGPPDVHCFAIRGADAARTVMQAQGWEQAPEDTVAEAITLHLNAQVPLEAYGAVAHLLNASTALDVTGVRYWDVHPDTARAVVEQVPRLDMKRSLLPVWQAEANRHPGCRAHFLSRYVQFGHRIRTAPFEE